jgi:hypothetical protein
VYGAGYNEDGELGQNNFTHYHSFVKLDSLPRIESIHANYHSSWFISSQKELYACGLNRNKQLDITDKLPETVSVPIKVEFHKQIRSFLSPHSWTTAFITTDDEIYTFGVEYFRCVDRKIFDAKELNSTIVCASYSAKHIVIVTGSQRGLKRLSPDLKTFADVTIILTNSCWN